MVVLVLRNNRCVCVSSASWEAAGQCLLMGSKEYFMFAFASRCSLWFHSTLSNCFYLESQASCYFFPLPCPSEKRERGRVALVGIYPSARAEPPHSSSICFCFLFSRLKAVQHSTNPGDCEHSRTSTNNIFSVPVWKVEQKNLNNQWEVSDP